MTVSDMHPANIILFKSMQGKGVGFSVLLEKYNYIVIIIIAITVSSKRKPDDRF